MNKKLSHFGLLGLVFGMVSFTACSSDDPKYQIPETPSVPEAAYGVPSDDMAGEAPIVTSNTVNIPNISAPMVEPGTDGSVGNISMTGIKGIDGDFMNLVGTGANDQNVWMTIDGKPKSISIVNGGGGGTRAAQRGLADIVFLVDNSGSMSEEADSLAKQILTWSKVIAQTVDAQFGCVGYGDNGYGVDGGMNMDDIAQLDTFLNYRDYNNYGTRRTYGFYGYDQDRLSTEALSSTGKFYNGSYNECGCLALHFADSLFNFRDGANRIYVNFTDEPNQPATYKQWSVETLNSEHELYNWNGSKGTVHSVYSGTDTLRYKAPDGSYYQSNLNNPYGWDETPWLMSEYTGGLTLFTNPYFRNFRLDDIEVTAAIVSSYILRFNITDDLKTGLHTIVLTVKDNKGNQASKKFENVSFAL